MSPNKASKALLALVAAGLIATAAPSVASAQTQTQTVRLGGTTVTSDDSGIHTMAVLNPGIRW